MAGYSALYCVGDSGGYLSADGPNRIYFQILVGDADRQWMEVHYFDSRIRPIVHARLVPAYPNDPRALVDACILFYPDHFKACSLLQPTAKALRRAMGRKSVLDFHLDANRMPESWPALRKEALPLFKRLNVFRADLEPYRARVSLPRNTPMNARRPR
jgi:hypothetical protein